MKIKVCVLFMIMMLVTGMIFATESNSPATKEPFVLQSPVFKNGQMMPYRYLNRGDNKSPALKWSNSPEGTASFSITCKDYDPPANGYVHWDIKDIPGSYSELPEGIPPVAKWKDGIIQRTSWIGPFPPNGVHSYHFVIEAKDAKGKTLAKAELIGRSD